MTSTSYVDGAGLPLPSIWQVSVTHHTTDDPPFPFIPWESRAITRDHKVIPKVYLSLSSPSVVIEETTLKEVTEKLGEAIIYQHGAECCSRYSLCYKSNRDDIAIFFSFDFPRNESTISSIWIGASRRIDTNKYWCSVSEMIGRKITHLNGISLDSSIKEIKDAFGKPTYIEKPFVAYWHRSSGYLAYQVYSVDSILEMEFQEGHMVWIMVYQAAWY